MKLRNLYLLNAVVCLVFALGLLLMTPVMLNLFGMDSTRDATVLAQLLAVELTVGGMTTLLARDVTDPQARGAINYGNMIAGVLGWFGYVLLAIYAAVALGFAYFQFFAPPD